MRQWPNKACCMVEMAGAYMDPPSCPSSLLPPASTTCLCLPYMIITMTISLVGSKIGS